MGNNSKIITLPLIISLLISQSLQVTKSPSKAGFKLAQAKSVAYTELTAQAQSQSTNCYSLFLTTMTDYSEDDKDELITTMATSICPLSVNTMAIEYKPYLCTFSSLFTYFYIESTSPDTTTISKYASSYCSNIQLVEDAKLTLYSSLVAISLDDETEFISECYDLLLAYESYNLWFDPMVPIDSITLDNLCGNIYTLYYALTYTYGYSGTTYFDYYIAKTSQLVVLEYLNYIKVMLYDECDSQTVEDWGAVGYCEEYIEPKVTFWALEEDICVGDSILSISEEDVSCETVYSAVFSDLNDQVISYTETMFTTVATALSEELIYATTT